MIPKKTIPLLISAALALAIAHTAQADDDSDQPVQRMLVVTDRDGSNEHRYQVDADGNTWVGSTHREYVPNRDAFEEDVDATLDAQQSLPDLGSRLIERDTFPDRPAEVSVVHPSDYAADLEAIDDMTRGRSTEDESYIDDESRTDDEVDHDDS